MTRIDRYWKRCAAGMMAAADDSRRGEFHQLWRAVIKFTFKDRNQQLPDRRRFGSGRTKQPCGDGSLWFGFHPCDGFVLLFWSRAADHAGKP